MANYDVDFSDDGFAGLMSVNLDNGEGPYEVRVLKKWAVRDYCSSGKLGDVAMVLIDKNYDLGAVMVQGVEGVTKVFVNPWTAGVVDFRKRLIRYLSGSSNYGGLIRRSALLPFSRNLEFIKKYPIKAIFELKNDPTLALILGGIPHVIALKIFENYIGAFHCSKCRASEYIVAPKVRLTIEVDDITGYTVFNAFDHVMVDVAVRNSHVSGSATFADLRRSTSIADAMTIAPSTLLIRKHDSLGHLNLLKSIVGIVTFVDIKSFYTINSDVVLVRRFIIFSF
ncbi:hypothetical protein QL285_069484 [Trifolium repens]|nr:hypothetical protein QL285_069484 [Trifolium repens]